MLRFCGHPAKKQKLNEKQKNFYERQNTNLSRGVAEERAWGEINLYTNFEDLVCNQFYY